MTTRQTSTGSADACDSLFNLDTVEGRVELVASESVDALVVRNVSGVNGLISKLTGTAGVIPQVAAVVIAYADGGTVDDYLAGLDSTLAKLSANDNGRRAPNLQRRCAGVPMAPPARRASTTPGRRREISEVSIDVAARRCKEAEGELSGLHDSAAPLRVIQGRASPFSEV